MPESKDFLMYKNRPLVRNGKTVYYGNMTDRYVIKMEIKSSKKVDDLEVADKVAVSLIHTDDNMSPKDRIIKSSEKTVFTKLSISAPFGLSERSANNFQAEEFVFFRLLFKISIEKFVEIQYNGVIYFLMRRKNKWQIKENGKRNNIHGRGFCKMVYRCCKKGRACRVFLS